jgi:hypothetical protein
VCKVPNLQYLFWQHVHDYEANKESRVHLERSGKANLVSLSNSILFVVDSTLSVISELCKAIFIDTISLN